MGDGERTGDGERDGLLSAVGIDHCCRRTSLFALCLY